MSGHGHVTPNPDGRKARCGGPGLCSECSKEAASKAAASRVRTTVVNKKDTHDFDLYIGRPTLYGNPFVVGVHAKNNADAVALYREWINSDDPEAAEVRAAIPALRGKRIACWCKPAPCHGDVLAEMADGAPQGLLPGFAPVPAGVPLSLPGMEGV